MESLSNWKISTLGLQHVLAMYAGAVIVPLIVGPAIGITGKDLEYLISIDLFMCGIATLLQVVGGKHIGVKLPVVLGCAFQAVAPMIAIGNIHGITAIYGAIICSGVVVIILSQFMSKVMHFFPPVVTGSVVTIIGVSLIPVAMGNAAGGQGAPGFGNLQNFYLATFTLLLVILFNKFLNGYMRAISVLLALVIGTVVAYTMGVVDFSDAKEASWIHAVRPFYFGLPTFNISAIITMVIVAIVSMIESTGVFLALGEVCERDLKSENIKKGLRAEGIATAIGGVFNAFPYTSFSQNVGLVALTKVKTRNVIIAAGIILITLGLLPKVAAVTATIPNAVLGGAMIAMFGMVIASGIKMLSKVDFNRQENSLIVAISVGIGLGAAVVPAFFQELTDSIRLLVQNGIVVGSIAAIFLNIIFNTEDMKKDKRTNNEREEKYRNRKQEQNKVI